MAICPLFNNNLFITLLAVQFFSLYQAESGRMPHEPVVTRHTLSIGDDSRMHETKQYGDIYLVPIETRENGIRTLKMLTVPIDGDPELVSIDTLRYIFQDFCYVHGDLFVLSRLIQTCCGGSRIVLYKYDNCYDLLWTKELDIRVNPDGRSFIESLPSGDIVLVSDRDTVEYRNENGVLINLLSLSGETQSQASIDGYMPLGIALDATGMVIATIQANDDMVTVTKTDLTGRILWQRAFPATMTVLFPQGFRLQKADDYIVIYGINASGSDRSDDPGLIILDGEGNIVHDGHNPGSGSHSSPREGRIVSLPRKGLDDGNPFLRFISVHDGTQNDVYLEKLEELAGKKLFQGGGGTIIGVGKTGNTIEGVYLEYGP